MKIDEHENRCEKLIEMTDVGRNFTLNDAPDDGVSIMRISVVH